MPTLRRIALASCLAVSLVGVAVAAASSTATPSFAQGVAAGEVTATSALLWARAPKAGPVQYEVKAGAKLVASGKINAARANDLVVQPRVRKLLPGQRYTYRFRQGAAVSAIGRVMTAPAPTADVRVRFALSGDADATAGADGKPGFNGFETYARMAAERNDFNVNMGDTIYSDSEVAGAAVALTVPAKWGKYKLGLALAPLRTLRASAGLYSHWDDHEFINDFTRAEHGEAIYTAGVKAFRDYAPVSYTAPRGLYRTFRWGRNVELFFLDQRSFRSGKVRAVCKDDLAPTAPVAVRQAFAALAPPLAQPVPAGCLEAINDPSRTMLGSAQYAEFVRAIRASQATWKIVLNEVPLLQFYALPYDRWEGYGAERAKLLADLASVSNVVFLTTDMHAHLVGEVRSTTFEPPGPRGTGIWEVVTGPVATNTYAKEIDSALGAPGTGDFVTSLFFKRPLPNGLGFACAATDTYGYAQIAATRTTLTVAPKAASGGPAVEKTGGACVPLVLTAK